MKRYFPILAASAFLLTCVCPNWAAELSASGFAAPVGIIELENGVLLVSEWGANQVSRLEASGAKASVIEGIAAPAGLAKDETGQIYIAGYGDGNIYKWNGSGKPDMLASGFRQPTGLLWADNALLVANRSAGTVERVDVNNGKRSIISEGHNLPVGIAVTENGDMFVSCYGGTVDRVDRLGKIDKISAGLKTPGVGILPASKNTVYVVDNAAGAVVELGRNGVIHTLAKNLAQPVALARTANGHIVAGTWGDGHIQYLEGNNE